MTEEKKEDTSAFACPTCGKSFNSKEEMKKHGKEHMKEKK